MIENSCVSVSVINRLLSLFTYVHNYIADTVLVSAYESGLGPRVNGAYSSLVQLKYKCILGSVTYS